MPATCYVEGLYAGTICVTPQAAQELKEAGIVAEGTTIGYFTLVEDESLLWKLLRKVDW